LMVRVALSWTRKRRETCSMRIAPAGRVTG
jgi:hypothetical protein